MAVNWNIGRSRGPNQIAAYPEIETSKDGLRRVYSRNVKRSLGMGRFDGVRVYRLAERRNNKWETVNSQTGPEEAKAFLEGSTK